MNNPQVMRLLGAYDLLKVLDNFDDRLKSEPKKLIEDLTNLAQKLPGSDLGPSRSVEEEAYYSGAKEIRQGHVAFQRSGLGSAKGKKQGSVDQIESRFLQQYRRSA